MSQPLLTTPRTLIVLSLASACWAFSFGLGAPLASLWLRDAGFSDTLIGLNTGIYYLGIAIASGAVPMMMRRWRSGCAVAGMLVSGLTVALFPYVGGLLGCSSIRLLNGVAAAMSLIPMESFVNRHSPALQRARNFGFYAFAMASGWALGNFVGLQLYADFPHLAFILGGLVGVLAGFIVYAYLPWPEDGPVEGASPSPLKFRRNFLSYGTAWSQGFLEGGMVAFLSVYLFFIGMSDSRVSWLTSGIMIGVILFQVPVAWLADRLGRTAVLIACYAVTALALACLPFCGASTWLAVWLFLLGACSGAFYPLGLAILGDRVPHSSLARANAWYLAINCCGSLSGPVILGAVMDSFGKRAIFVASEIGVLGVLVAWLVVRACASWSNQGDEVLGSNPSSVEIYDAA